MATKKTTTYEQALRAMRRFQDEYAMNFNCIISIKTYHWNDSKSLELTVSVWDDHNEMQQRRIEWTNWREDSYTFAIRFQQFKKEFYAHYIEGQATVINY